VIAYVDASVLLRVVLGEPGRLAEWEDIDEGVTSELAEVECLRSIDRLALLGRIPPGRAPERRAAVYRLLDELSVFEVARPVLSRAATPFPTPLGTLDAIHLATAILWREQNGRRFPLATHDAALGVAARASGFEVVGC
jgi:predicted nucleic acid-binding protein